MANQKRTFDYEQVKLAARDTPDLIEFGARLGLGTESVNYFLDNDEQFAKAYEGGIEQRNTLDKKYTPEDFYKWGKEKLANGEIAELYKTSVIRISQVLKSPEIKAAYEKGKAGLAFDDEFSTASILAAGAGESKLDLNGRDLSQNSKLGQLRTNIVEAVRLGNKTVSDIAKFIGEADKVSVYNALCNLASEGKICKRNGSYGESAEYFLPDAGDAAAAEKPIPKGEPKPANKSEEITPRERILKAIDDGHHLTRAIIAATGLDGIQVADELDDMEGCDIDVRYAGNTRCYFRIDQVPQGRLVLDGKGGVDIIPDEPKKLEPTEHALAILNKLPVPKTEIPLETEDEETFEPDFKAESEFEPDTPEMPENLEKEEEKIVNSSKNEKTSDAANPKPGGIEYTEEMFEKFGRDGLSAYAIAKELCVQDSKIYYQLKKEKFKDAYDRGKQQRNEASVLSDCAPDFAQVEKNSSAPIEPPAEETDSENVENEMQENVENEMQDMPVLQTVPVLQEAVRPETRAIEKADPAIRDSKIYENMKTQFEDAPRVVLVGIDPAAGTRAAQTHMIALQSGKLNIVAENVNIFDLSDREFSLFGEIRKLISNFKEGTDEEKAAA